MRYNGTVDINGEKVSVYSVVRTVEPSTPIINFLSSTTPKEELKSMVKEYFTDEGLSYEERVTRVAHSMLRTEGSTGVDDCSFETRCCIRGLSSGFIYGLPSYVLYTVLDEFICALKLSPDGSYEFIENEARYLKEEKLSTRRKKECIKAHPEHWGNAA